MDLYCYFSSGCRFTFYQNVLLVWSFALTDLLLKISFSHLCVLICVLVAFLNTCVLYYYLLWCFLFSVLFTSLHGTFCMLAPSSLGVLNFQPYISSPQRRTKDLLSCCLVWNWFDYVLLRCPHIVIDRVHEGKWITPYGNCVNVFETKRSMSIRNYTLLIDFPHPWGQVDW